MESFPLQVGRLPRCAVPSLGLSFPTLGRFNGALGSLPASGLAPAAAALGEGGFVLSAQLLWLGHPGRALPCFVSAAGPSTDTILAASGTAEPQRVPPSPNCWPVQYEPKGCAGANWHDCATSSRILPGATEERALLLPSSLQRLLWACSHRRGLCPLPSGQGRRLW